MANIGKQQQSKFVNADETQRILDRNGKDVTPKTTDELINFVLGELVLGGMLIKRDRLRYYVVNIHGNIFDVRPDCATRVTASERVVPVIDYFDGTLTMFKDVRLVKFVDTN